MLVVRPIEFTKKDKEVIPEELVSSSPLQSTTDVISVNQVTQSSVSKQSTVETTKKSKTTDLKEFSSVSTSILTSLCQEKITVFLTWNKMIPFEFSTSSLLSDVFNTFVKKVMLKEDATQYRLVKHQQPNSILPMDKTLAELLICDKTVFASMS